MTSLTSKYLGQTDIVEFLELQTIPFAHHSTQLSIEDPACGYRGNGHTVAQEKYNILGTVLVWWSG